MIKKQLSYLYRDSHVFLYDKQLYELLYSSKRDYVDMKKKMGKCFRYHKYRIIFDDDHYDYVVDSKLRKRLDRYVAKLKRAKY